jgi:hypothetical protein
MKQMALSEEIEKQLGLKIKFEEPPKMDIEVIQMNNEKTKKEDSKNNKKIITGESLKE